MCEYDCPVLSEIQAALWAAGHEDCAYTDVVEGLIVMGIGRDDLDEYEHIDQEHGHDYMNALWTVFKWKGEMYKVSYNAVSHMGGYLGRLLG